ncbi:MAG: DUF3877 family protein [Lachnospiraceae bacterium]|nr:DUF3877 family protein [Lachnospiraceae bacterium]
MRNLTDQVMEQQAKLGYMKEKIRLYYPLSSLRHMLGKDDACDASKMQEILEELADSTAESFGAMRITHQGDRFCFVLSEEISERIHRETPAKAFIHELIGLVGQHETNMEQILELFKAQPGGCIMEHIDSGEFDYVIRFKEGTDRYLYCFKDEGCHITYHRFLPEDYEEFGF